MNTALEPASIDLTEENGGSPGSEPPVAADEGATTYFSWKKNAPHLYTTLITASLPWPSLTVQWLPEVTKDKVSSQSLLLGTRTSGQAPEYLRFGKVDLPAPTITSLDKYDPERSTIGEHSTKTAANVTVYQRIDHEGEVNKARYMPQNPNLVASISSTGQVSVFDATHYPRNPCGFYKPDIALIGHTAEGFGLSWSRVQEGLLATGANDKQMMVWDIRDYNTRTGELKPKYKHEYKSAVNAVGTHCSNPHYVAAVTDDEISVVDWRSAQDKLTTGQGGLSLAVNPVNEFLLAVGTESGEVQLWDLRNTGAMLHSLSHHTAGVVALDWNPRFPGTLVSGSLDSTVMVWDAGKLKPQFCHRGHTKAVEDVAWNPANSWIASVSADNSLHVWSPSP